MRIFQFDLVDHINAEIEVHRLISQNVLELLGDPGHLVAPSHRQDLGETAVEENTFCYRIEANQIAQQLLVGFGGSRCKVGIREAMSMADAPRCLC